MNPTVDDLNRDWCPRCQHDYEDHATAVVDDETNWICPVQERAVDDDCPQQQLADFQ